MTDEEVQDLIDDLSMMAKWALKEAARINDNRISPRAGRSKNNSTEI